MLAKLKEKESFTVIGPAKKGSHRNPKDKQLIASLWEKISNRMYEIEHKVHSQIITGVCIPPASPDYYYNAGVEADEHAALPEGMVKHTFPNSYYLMYTHRGSVTRLFNTYGRIWGEYSLFVRLDMQSCTDRRNLSKMD